jgi:hypothetical protein
MAIIPVWTLAEDRLGAGVFKGKVRAFEGDDGPTVLDGAEAYG